MLTEASCPTCRSSLNPIVGLLADRTYSRCNECGLIYQSVFDDSHIDYDASYFTSQYKDHYGKTYLEDFASIYNTSLKRLTRITRIGGTLLNKRLLDVGCAYGVFLSAAYGQGMSVAGVEMCQPVAIYAREHLLASVWNGSFLHYPGERPFDVLTMWYTIEHFQQLDEALRKTAALVKPGGVFAFSTPNSTGISGFRDLREFLRKGAIDHYTVWNPDVAHRILYKYGFKVVRTHVTGHHPERWPRGLRWAASGLSRLLRMGDTFEVYAVRVDQT